MDFYGTGRLAAKDVESAIVARIQQDFNLTPVLARAHYEQMARYFSEFGHVPARPGELCYLAVAAGCGRALRARPRRLSRCGRTGFGRTRTGERPVDRRRGARRRHPTQEASIP